MTDLIARLGQAVAARPEQVRAAVDLLDGGATVPFIARYRKEATGGLDDIQLRELQTQLSYLRELDARRTAIVKSITEQGKLTPDLAAALAACTTKQELEDLYAPYKPKRRTKGMIAREAGLEALADALLADPTLDPTAQAANYLRPATGEGSIEGADFSTPALVLDGVRDLLAERWADDAALVQTLRQWLWDNGTLQSRLAAGKNGDDAEAQKFRDYFEHDEPIARTPSHRALAMFRGRSLEWLDIKLIAPEAISTSATAESNPKPAVKPPSLAEGRIALHLGWRHQGRAADDLLRRCVAWAWRVKLSLSLERDLFTRLRDEAEAVAVKVFADNLRDLLLAAPAGPKVVMGLDPGIRTGVKVAVVDATGRLLDTATVYPHEPRRDWDGSLATLGRLAKQHGVQLIAVGNGTASRETEKLASELIALAAKAEMPPSVSNMVKVVVSEAGASVYSASEYASTEMPDVDVSLRGAASIARRLQDPLAELVKIDPKSIGVGQYQHDVNQSQLAQSLDAVVEDCVNAVGVDLNTASAPLLSRVSGLSASTARSVVRWRDTHGAFANRRQLLDVTGLGPKAFEQCAGFLRIRGGTDALDATGVHPESYELVQALLARLQKPIEQVMGKPDLLKALKPENLATPRFGVPTVRDILAELEKPGRDPRPSFQVARYSSDVADIADLKPGMVLEGTVSNVAQFGAFVDLGVHQDGLIHVSQLANRFVSDAREVVKTGQVVKVKVLEVDLPRKRIALTLRMDAAVPAPGEAGRAGGAGAKREDRAALARHGRTPQAAAPGAMAAAFAKLRS